MSTDKYPSIFSRQVGTIVYIACVFEMWSSAVIFSNIGSGVLYDIIKIFSVEHFDLEDIQP